MKPHIVRIHGVWTCRLYYSLGSYCVPLRPVGDGYTPLEAFRDWVSQQ